MPSSSARWIVAIDSSSSVGPYQADIPMQPRPCSETSSPCPSVRVSMSSRYPEPGLSAARYSGRRSWPSRSGKPRSPAATSAARRTRSARRSVNVCPQLRAAEAAASRLPDLRHVQGPRSRAAPHRRSRSCVTVRIAVDAMGGDRGPDEIVAGALEARADGDRADPLRRRRRSTRAGSSCAPTTEVIEMDEKPAEAVRGEAGQLARRRRAAPSPRGGPTPSSRRATPARCSPPACSSSAASRASCGRRSPCRSRRARGPSVLLDCGANADARARAPAPVRARWARSSPRRSSASASPRCGSSRSARSRRRGTS